MRKYLKLIISISILLITTTAFARDGVDWAINDDYKDNIKHYALYKAIHGIPVKYSIYINPVERQVARDIDKEEPISHQLSQLSLELIKAGETERMTKIVERAFYTWFEDTWTMIKEDGRAKEFEDIKKILLNKVKLEKVSEDADINFNFISPKALQKICGETNDACIDFDKPLTLFIINPFYYKQKFKHYPVSTAIHEVGHYFALGDQYEDFKRNSLVHSTAERIGNRDSIMAAYYETHLSCDDVDGFINLIDLTLALENDGEFSKRARYGWDSFCNGKENGNGEAYKEQRYALARPVFKDIQIRGDITYYFGFNSEIEYGIDTNNNIFNANGSFLCSYSKSEDDVFPYYYYNGYNRSNKLIKKSIFPPHVIMTNSDLKKDLLDTIKTSKAK